MSGAKISRGAGLKSTSEMLATPFDPTLATDEAPERSRQRRHERRTAARSVAIHWPESRKLQHEAFDGWHAHAMGVIHEAKGSFRTIAVLSRFINWKKGVFFPTNATIAACAGQCSEKTISRDLADYEALGIVQVKSGWRKSAAGKWVTARFLIPSLPIDLPAGAALPADGDEGDDLEIRMDTSGLGDSLFETPIRMDTSGPNRMDTSGPATHECTPEEGARRDVSA